MTEKRSLAQRLAIVAAVVVQIGATFLPQLGLGAPIGDRSDAVRTLITPAGWAFAIWGPLFLGSGIFALWQTFPNQKDNALLNRIGWPAAVALSMQGIWAIYTQFADLTYISSIIILISLAALLVILRELVKVRRAFTTGEKWIAATTFSALAAWLTAASIVNISASLLYHGIGEDGTYPIVAAAVVLLGGAIAAAAVWCSRGNPWYAAVFCWALLAIFLNGGQESTALATTCAVSAIAVLYAMCAKLSDRADRQHWIGGGR
ncbi:MAG: hypothetical protein WA948_01615 [Pontixanthobacter sp.]